MSEIDISLPAALQDSIERRTLGLVQEEIGVLTTNLFQERAKNEALCIQRTHDVALIEALKNRAFTAEDNIKILQIQHKEMAARIEEAEKTLKRRRKPTKSHPSS